MIDWLKAIVLIGGAQIFIMAGIYFTGGILMQKTMAGFYDSVPQLARLGIALVTAFAAGNLVMAYAYGHFAPAIAAPVTMFFMVVTQIAFPVIAFGLRPSPWIVPATIAMTASCIWISLLLIPKK